MADEDFLYPTRATDDGTRHRGGHRQMAVHWIPRRVSVSMRT